MPPKPPTQLQILALIPPRLPIVPQSDSRALKNSQSYSSKNSYTLTLATLNRALHHILMCVCGGGSGGAWGWGNSERCLVIRESFQKHFERGLIKATLVHRGGEGVQRTSSPISPSLLKILIVHFKVEDYSLKIRKSAYNLFSVFISERGFSALETKKSFGEILSGNHQFLMPSIRLDKAWFPLHGKCHDHDTKTKRL